MYEILAISRLSYLNVLPLEPFGLLLIVKINTVGLFVCYQRVPPVLYLDHLTDENLFFCCL
jgi:hypothetical protein